MALKYLFSPIFSHSTQEILNLAINHRKEDRAAHRCHNIYDESRRDDDDEKREEN